MRGANTIRDDGHRLMLFDRGGKSGKQIGATGRFVAAVLSPNGRQAVINEDSPAGPSLRLLSLMDMERGVLTRFTTGSDDERNPVWAPDGQSVVFQSRRGGHVRRLPPQCRRAAPRATSYCSHPRRPCRPPDFSSDGKLLLLTRGAAGDQRVWVLPLTGDRKPVEAFPGATLANNAAVFSPDDKWIAYAEQGGHRTPKSLSGPIPPTTGGSTISPSSGRRPHWAPDGKSIVVSRRRRRASIGRRSNQTAARSPRRRR